MRSGNPQRGGRQRACGFTYMGALFLVALLGLALAGAGQLWSVTSLRAKEHELLWVGSQYARALRSYHAASPGARHYPKELAELVEDRRFPQPRRHLRRLYPDPFTGRADWEPIRGADGRIAGVRSRSTATTRKHAHFPPEWSDFAGRATHAEWEFVAERVQLR